METKRIKKEFGYMVLTIYELNELLSKAKIDCLRRRKKVVPYSTISIDIEINNNKSLMCEKYKQCKLISIHGDE